MFQVGSIFRAISDNLAPEEPTPADEGVGTVSEPGAKPVLEKGSSMKEYGIQNTSYRIIEKPNGRIELQVHHGNQDVRDRLKRHARNPRYFLEHLETYRKDHARAWYWLAQVIDDYYNDFASNLVDITFH